MNFLFEDVALIHYLILGTLIFTIGATGIFINKKNVITLLMSIELMLLSVNINFVAFSHFQGNLVGQVFTLMILTVAAAEAAIGLAILVVYFRNKATIDVTEISDLRG
jgi:NADH-quinone oxidoreductase subunit K